MTVEAYINRRRNIFSILGKSEEDTALVQDFNAQYFDQNIEEPLSGVSSVENTNLYPHGLKAALLTFTVEDEDSPSSPSAVQEDQKVEFTFNPADAKPVTSYGRRPIVRIEHLERVSQRTSENTFERVDSSSFISKLGRLAVLKR